MLPVKLNIENEVLVLRKIPQYLQIQFCNASPNLRIPLPY